MAEPQHTTIAPDLAVYFSGRHGSGFAPEVTNLDRKERELGKDGNAAAGAVSPRVSQPEGGPEKKPPKTDELFRRGENLYALGMYQQAIHVWTRILFLERRDTRARSAIERAKRAVSERQRELDLELAAAAELLDTGDIEAAASGVRHVLSLDPRHAEGHQLAERIAARNRRSDVPPTRAVADEDASESLRHEKSGLLQRVSRKSPATLRPRGNASSNMEKVGKMAGLKMAGFGLGVILVFASGALYLHLNWESIVSDGAFVSGSALAPGGAGPLDARVPGASELRFYNGARLYAKGRYREALAELSLVGRDDAVSERARSLILRIEDRLLRGGEFPPSSDDTVKTIRP